MHHLQFISHYSWLLNFSLNIFPKIFFFMGKFTATKQNKQKEKTHNSIFYLENKNYGFSFALQPDIQVLAWGIPHMD